ITGLDLDFSNLTTDSTDPYSNFYGIHLNDQVGSTASTEYGLYVEGTNWDYGIYSKDDVKIEGQCVTGDTLLPIMSNDKLQMSNQIQMTNDKFDIKEFDIDLAFDIKNLTFKPIKDVQAGDLVLSLNEKTGKLEPAKINGLLDMGVKPIYEMETEDGRKIRTTGNHPYLVNTKTTKNPANNKELLSLGFLASGSSDHSWQSHEYDSQANNSQEDVEQKHGINKGHSGNLLFNNLRLNAKKKVAPDMPPNINAISGLSTIDGKTIEAKESMAISEQMFESLSSWSLESSLNIQPNYNRELTQLSSASPATFLPSKIGRASWTKVAYLNIGDEIAATNVKCQNSNVKSNPNVKCQISDNFGDVRFVKIKSITLLPPEQVYDIEVEGTHNFIANGIVAHNTYIGGSTDDYLNVEADGDLLFVDADGGASITGPAGGGLTITAYNSSAWQMTANNASDKTLTISATNSDVTGKGLISMSAEGDINIDTSAGALYLNNTNNQAINTGTGNFVIDATGTVSAISATTINLATANVGST
ncbi:MAG: hypothetical protein AAB116_00995, partial [Candidatus Poribacteria bacterium]